MFATIIFVHTSINERWSYDGSKLCQLKKISCSAVQCLVP